MVTLHGFISASYIIYRKYWPAADLSWCARGWFRRHNLGATQTILDGNQLDRIFAVGAVNGMPVTIKGLTIQNGITADSGGGIFILTDATTLVTLQKLIVQGNSARWGAGIMNSGRTLLEDSLVQNNTAFFEGFGAGIASYLPTTPSTDLYMTIRNTTIRGNQSTSGDGMGGAILNGFTSGSPSYTVNMLIENSLIDHNGTGYRGGAVSTAGNLTVINSTFSQNQAVGSGEGGAFDVQAGTVTISHSTIVNNSAASGGGFLVTGGTVYINGSIVAQNSNGNCNSSLNSSGYTLESANVCGFAGTGDLVNTNPLLGPLQDNGGATWTHALLENSPAIDAGTNIGCPAFDQRGFHRPEDGDEDGQAVCDIGAYERMGPRLYNYLSLVLNKT
jgi:hypothetical protein